MSIPESYGNLAVLVLNLNGAHFLDDCLSSLLEVQHPPCDIYLIDNHSEDSSVELVRRNYPSVRIIQNHTNFGFGRAYDRAIRKLHHKYFVLLNNDTTVDKKWLEALVKVADSDERIAACGSKILMMSDNTVIDHAGGLFTVIGSGLDLGKWTRDNGSRQTTMEVGFVCGCAMLIRRTAYIELGGFDPNYVIYHDDVDLCWRFRLRGYRVMYVADSVVYHAFGGGKIKGLEDPSKVYLCQKNRLSNVIKNLGLRKLMPALAVSSAYDATRILRFLILLRMDLISSLLRGYLDCLRELPVLLRRRRRIQNRRIVSDKEIGRFFMPVVKSALTYRQLLSGIPSETRDSNCLR